MAQISNKIVHISENEIFLKAFNLGDVLWKAFLFGSFACYIIYLKTHGYVTETPLTTKDILIFIFIGIVVYDLAIRDIVININKTIVLTDSDIIINRKRYARDSVKGIYVATGAYSTVAASVRIGIWVKNKSIFRKSKFPIIALHNKNKSILIAQELATFLKCDFIDQISSR
jgi:hypothetical protein